MVLPLPRVFEEGCSPPCYRMRRQMVNSDPADTGPGQQTSGSNQGSSSAGSDSQPGPHRFIGIGIVAGLAFILLVLWLTCASWPRRMAGFKPRRRKEMLALEESEDKPDPTSPVDVIFRPPKAKVNEAKTLRNGPRFESAASCVDNEQHLNKARMWSST